MNGTRIAVADILQRLASGMSYEVAFPNFSNVKGFAPKVVTA